MILDQLSHHKTYLGLGPRFVASFGWLANFKPETADGRIDIDGDNVFALVQSYDTAPPAEKKYEAHRLYADLQYIAAGTETIHYAPFDRLQTAKPYDPEKDYLLYSDPAVVTALHLGPGSFAIFHPADAHKPGCIDGAICRMKKVVIKIRL